MWAFCLSFWGPDQRRSGRVGVPTQIFYLQWTRWHLWCCSRGLCAATDRASAHNQLQRDRRGASSDQRKRSDRPKAALIVNLITKSGGNAYHGAAEYAGTNHHFESNNITAELRRQGVVSAPKLITRKDGGGQLGGKLIQDKLWFFADLRYRQVIREIPFAARPDGSIIHRPQHQFFQEYKLSGQLNQNNNRIAFWHRYGDHERRSATSSARAPMEQNKDWGAPVARRNGSRSRPSITWRCSRTGRKRDPVPVRPGIRGDSINT